jgi:hypothetical protein
MLKIDFYTVEYSSAIRATGRLILYSGSYWWVGGRGSYVFHPEDEQPDVVLPAAAPAIHTYH